MDIDKKVIKQVKSETIVFLQDGHFIKCFIFADDRYFNHQIQTGMEEEVNYTKKFAREGIAPNILKENIICKYNNNVYRGFKMQHVGISIWHILKILPLHARRRWFQKYKAQFENIFKIISNHNLIYIDINLHNFTKKDDKLYLIDYDPYYVKKYDCKEMAYDIMCFLLNLQVNNTLNIRNYLKYNHSEKEIKKIIFNEGRINFIYKHYYKNSLNPNGFGYSFL